MWSDLEMWEEWMVLTTMPAPLRPAPFRKELDKADVAETRAICEIREEQQAA